MIRMVGSTLGVKVKGKLSRHTVQRSIQEGGVASRIQMGYELANSKSMFYEHLKMLSKTANSVKSGFTTSSDGTTHKNTNYDSRHFAYKVPLCPGSNKVRPVI
jgi:hypothetical protein